MWVSALQKELDNKKLTSEILVVSKSGKQVRERETHLKLYQCFIVIEGVDHPIP